MLDRRPRPLLVRGAELRRAPDRADDQAGRPVADGRLADRARTTSSTASSASRASSASPASARWAHADSHGRGTAPAGQARARPRQRERRPPHCATPTSRTPAACAGWARRSRRCRKLDRALVVGSFLRKDHPLLAQRLRQAARQGAEIHSVNALADDWLMPVATQLTRRPERLGRARWPTSPTASPRRRAAPRRSPASARRRPRPSPPRCSIGDAQGRAAGQRRRAASAGLDAAGAGATGSPRPTGATVGYLGEAGNSVGAQLVNALPRRRRPERRPDAVAADEGAVPAERRARARRRQRRRRARRARRLGPGRRADAVPQRRRRRRRRAAADRAVHRDRRHLRQRRRPRADRSRASPVRWARRARPGRCCACWATCSACPASASSRPTRCWPRRWATPTTLAARLNNDADAAGRRCRPTPPPASSASPTCRSTSTDSLVRRALVAAADRRRARAAGLAAGAAVGRPRPGGRRQGAREPGRGGRRARRRVSTRRSPRRPCACPPATC